MVGVRCHRVSHAAKQQQGSGSNLGCGRSVRGRKGKQKAHRETVRRPMLYSICGINYLFFPEPRCGICTSSWCTLFPFCKIKSSGTCGILMTQWVPRRTDDCKCIGFCRIASTDAFTVAGVWVRLSYPIAATHMMNCYCSRIWLQHMPRGYTCILLIIKIRITAF